MIPFNKPFLTGNEIEYIKDAHVQGQLSGDGKYTKLCHQYLEDLFLCHRALLTHSGTAALEMAAILCEIGPGDEIVMPSYTFVSTANAFLLRGGKPIFVGTSQNLNSSAEQYINAVTDRTKCIVVVHYGGFCCDMEKLTQFCQARDIILVEDAAQAIGTKFNNKLLGTFGDLACFSFHETKNIISGEGGCLVINNKKYSDRAEVIREKGTNRSRFLRGSIDKYTWCDIGSSYLPGEIIAAFLFAQLEQLELISQKRLEIWENYHSFFEGRRTRLETQLTSEKIIHNGHIYYIVFDTAKNRSHFINSMRTQGVQTVFHYVPLHTSEVAKQYQLTQHLPEVQSKSERLVRLPIWLGLDQNTVFKAVHNTLNELP